MHEIHSFSWKLAVRINEFYFWSLEDLKYKDRRERKLREWQVRGPGREGPHQDFVQYKFDIARNLCSAFLWHFICLEGVLAGTVYCDNRDCYFTETASIPASQPLPSRIIELPFKFNLFGHLSRSFSTTLATAANQALLTLNNVFDS